MHTQKSNLISSLDKAIRDDDVVGLNGIVKSLDRRERAALFCRPLFAGGRNILQHALAVGKDHSNLNAVKTILRYSTVDSLNRPYQEEGNAEDSHALVLALKGNEENIEALLATRDVNWGSSVDKDGNTALGRMLGDSDILFRKNIFSKVLDKHPQALDRINKLGNNVMHMACNAGSLERVVACVDKVTSDPRYEKDLVALLGHKNGNGDTPLHIAYRSLDPKEVTDVFVASLTDRAACLNLKSSLSLTRNDENKTAISCALEAGKMSVLDVCIGNKECEVEAICSLMEHNRVNELHGFTEKVSSVDVMKEVGHRLLSEPKRFAKILEDKQDSTMADYWRAHWETFFENQQSALKFFSCVAMSGNTALSRDIVSAAVTSGRYGSERSLSEKVTLGAVQESIKGGGYSLEKIVDNDFRYSFSSRQAVNLIHRDMSAGALQWVLQHCDGNAREEVCKKLAEPVGNGASILEMVIDSCDPSEIGNLIDATHCCSPDFSRIRSYGRAALKEDMSRIGLNYAKSGEFDKLSQVIESMPHVLYSVNRDTRKSLIEVAADYGHGHGVRLLIDLHKREIENGVREEVVGDIQRSAVESIRQMAAVSPKDAAAVISEYHTAQQKEISKDDALRILKSSSYKDRNVLNEVLEGIHPELKRSKLNTSRRAHIDRSNSVFRKYLVSPEKQHEKRANDNLPKRSVSNQVSSSGNFKEYGLLLKHVPMVRETVSDMGKFRTGVLQNFKTFDDFNRTSLANKRGHSIFTIVASFGVPEQFDVLLSDYKKKCGMAAKGYQDISPLGSPIQCALQAGNFTMANHIISVADKGEICKQHGEDRENFLHSIVRASAFDTLYTLPHAKGDKKLLSNKVLASVTQENAMGLTPLDIALTSSKENTSALLAFIGRALSPEDMQTLIGSKDLTTKALAQNDTTLLEWIFDVEQRHNSNQSKEHGIFRKKRIEALGSASYEEALFARACENENHEIARFLHRKINERITDKAVRALPRASTSETEVSGSELSDKISANISASDKRLLHHLARSNVYNPVIYDDLVAKLGAELVDHEFFIEQAIKFDNPDLLRHVPVEKVMQSVNAQNLLTENKDNLLSFFLENSTGESLAAIDEAVIAGIMGNPNMAKSRMTFTACATESALRSETLHAAISSGNLEYIKQQLRKDPSLIAKSQNLSAEEIANGEVALLPYDYALQKCPQTEKESELVKYLAHRTMDFALEEAVRERAKGRSSHDEEGPTISHEDIEKFPACVTRAMIEHGSSLNLSSSLKSNLDSYIAASSDKIFQEDGHTPGLLRRALEREDIELSEALIDHHVQRLLDGYIQQDGQSTSGNRQLNSDAINRKTDGRSMLHLAAMNGSYKVLKELIELGGDPSILTDNGENLAHLCARAGLQDENGGYVFEGLINDDPSLNVVDKSGKGILEHVAECADADRTHDMLERVIKSDPPLDSVLAGLSPRERVRHVEKTLTQAHQNREDCVIHDFLDKNIPANSKKSKESRTLEALRKSRNAAKSENPDKLAQVLEHESSKSFKEIEALSMPTPVAGRVKRDLFNQQKELFDIVRNGSLTSKNLSSLNVVPIDVFTSRDPEYGISPLDSAVDSCNVDFIKYLMENRADVLRPNITNPAGDNLVIQIGKLIANNPHVADDEHFVKLYQNLLITCGCSIESYGAAPAESILEKVEGLKGDALVQSAKQACKAECSLRQDFNEVLSRIPEGHRSEVTRNLSVLSSVHTKYALNTVNPFHHLVSHILNDETAVRNGLTDDQRAYIREFIQDPAIRNLIRSVDKEGNNPLQSALSELTTKLQSTSIGVPRANLLHEVCLEVYDGLKREDKKLAKDVFLKHRNCRGDNFIESIASVAPTYDLFRALETKFSTKTISENCDINAILAKSAGQNAMQDHLCLNYSVFPIGDVDVHGNSRIHQACTSGNYDAFLSVMSTGGNINQLDKNGNSPLQSLLIHVMQNRGNITQGHINAIRTLVKHGAPLHHKNNDGYTACDLAKILTGPLFGKKESCLEMIADSRVQYHDLKEKVKKEVEGKFLLSPKKETRNIECDISGSLVSLDMGDTKLGVSKFLSSNVCQNNSLRAASFSFNDGKDKGTVEKVGDKRNYVAVQGKIKMDLSWKTKHGKTEKLAVEINSDGSISIQESFIKSCGEKGEKLDYSNCQVYVGGLHISEALRIGRWRSAEQTKEKGDKELAQSRDLFPDDHGSPGLDNSVQPHHDSPDHSRFPAQEEKGLSRSANDNNARGAGTSPKTASGSPLDGHSSSVAATSAPLFTRDASSGTSDSRSTSTSGTDVGNMTDSNTFSGNTDALDKGTSPVPQADNDSAAPEMDKSSASTSNGAGRSAELNNSETLADLNEHSSEESEQQSPVRSRANSAHDGLGTAEITDDVGNSAEHTLHSVHSKAPGDVEHGGKDEASTQSTLHTDDTRSKKNGNFLKNNPSSADKSTGPYTEPSEELHELQSRKKLTQSSLSSPASDVAATDLSNNNNNVSPASRDSDETDSLDDDDDFQRFRSSSESTFVDGGSFIDDGFHHTSHGLLEDRLSSETLSELDPQQNDSGIHDESYESSLDSESSSILQDDSGLLDKSFSSSVTQEQLGDISPTSKKFLKIAYGLPSDNEYNSLHMPDDAGVTMENSLNNNTVPQRSWEGEEEKAWENVIRSGIRAKAMYAINITPRDNIMQIGKEIKEVYDDVTSRGLARNVESSELKKGMQEIFDKHGVQYKFMGMPEIHIKNGKVQGDLIPQDFSSPYGFGARVDSLISDALDDVQEIAERSGLNLDLKLSAVHLPLLAAAVNNFKDHPGEYTKLHSLRMGETSPIPQEEGKKILSAISQMTMPDEKPKIEPVHKSQAQGFQETLGMFRNIVKKAQEDLEGKRTKYRLEDRPEQKVLSESDSRLLYEIGNVALRERDYWEHDRVVIDEEKRIANPITGLVKDRHPTLQKSEIVHQVGKKAKEAASYNAGIVVEESRTSPASATLESAGKGVMETAGYAAGLVQDISPNAQKAEISRIDMGEDIAETKEKAENGSLALRYYNTLSAPGLSKNDLFSSMKEMLSETRENPKDRDVANWTILVKSCRDAGMHCAFNLTSNLTSQEGFDSVVGELVKIYRKLANEKPDDSRSSKIIREYLESALPKNGIMRLNLRDTNVTVKNGDILDSAKVPSHFDSRYGFGPYVDEEIRKAAADVGKISQRSSLDSKVVIKRSSLPNLVLSLQQIRNRPQGFEFVMPENIENTSAIDIKEGKSFLTQFNNMCTKEEGAHASVTPKKPDNVVAKQSVRLMTQKFNEKIEEVAEKNNSGGRRGKNAQKRHSAMVPNEKSDLSFSAQTAVSESGHAKVNGMSEEKSTTSSISRDMENKAPASMHKTTGEFSSCISSTSSTHQSESEYLPCSTDKKLSGREQKEVAREVRECAKNMSDLELHDDATPSSPSPSPIAGSSLPNSKGHGSHSR